MKPRSIIRPIRNVAAARAGSTRVREKFRQPLAPAMIVAGPPVIAVLRKRPLSPAHDGLWAAGRRWRVRTAARCRRRGRAGVGGVAGPPGWASDVSTTSTALPTMPAPFRFCQASICATQSVKGISLKHRLRWAKLRPSDGSAQPAPESFTPRPVKQFRPAALGAAARSAPKIGHCRSRNRAKRTSVSRHNHMSRR